MLSRASRIALVSSFTIPLVVLFLSPLRADAADAATGDVSTLRSEVRALRETVERLRQMITEQQRRLDALSPLGAVAAAPPAPAASPPSDLERQLAKELGTEAAPAAAPTPAAQPWSPTAPIVLAGGGKSFLDLSLDVLAVGGTSTTPDIERLETGGHDPVQRGFTLQNVETILSGAVDPYFTGQGNIVLQLDRGSETTIEIEEAFLTTTSLPFDLQVKAGQFLTDFGRLNTQHPHTWDFVDQPLVNGRLLGGDGMRNPGVRVSWLVPTPFYSELFATVQNSQGETAASFRGEEGEEVAGRVLTDRGVHSLGDMLYVPRYAASFDLSDTQTLLVGTSAAFGPNASGGDTRTSLYGVDLFWKWKPTNALGGFPFVKWQSEAMYRRYRAGAFVADLDGDGVDDLALPAETLEDWGAYSQLVWGFTQGWTTAIRGDYVAGDDGVFEPDPARETRWRISPNLTWYPTEFSKLRFQLNHDHSESEGSDDSFWVQMEFTLGAHGAHKF